MINEKETKFPLKLDLQYFAESEENTPTDNPEGQVVGQEGTDNKTDKPKEKETDKKPKKSIKEEIFEAFAEIFSPKKPEQPKEDNGTKTEQPILTKEDALKILELDENKLSLLDKFAEQQKQESIKNQIAEITKDKPYQLPDEVLSTIKSEEQAKELIDIVDKIIATNELIPKYKKKEPAKGGTNLGTQDINIEAEIIKAMQEGDREKVKQLRRKLQ